MASFTQNFVCEIDLHCCMLLEFVLIVILHCTVYEYITVYSIAMHLVCSLSTVMNKAAIMFFYIPFGT